MSEGCHKCGGYPGNKEKDRSALYQCTKCGFFTCNQHRTVMGACPNCKSPKLRTVMTQGDVRRASTGGMPGQKFAGKSGGGGGASRRDDETEALINSGGAMGSSGPSKPTINVIAVVEGRSSGPSQTAAQRAISSKLNQLIQEGQNGRDAAPFAKGNVMQLATEDMLERLRGSSDRSMDVSRFDQTGNTDRKARIVDDTEDLGGERGAYLFLRTNLDTPTAADTLADDEAAPVDTPKDDDFSGFDAINENDHKPLLQEEEDPYSSDSQLMDLLDTSKPIAPERFVFTDAYFRINMPESVTKYRAFLASLAKEQEKKRFQDSMQVAVISFDPLKLNTLTELPDLLKNTSNLFAVAGYGPTSIVTLNDTSLAGLRQFILKTRKIIAIGDVGLDLHFAPYTLKEQIKLLKGQIALGAELGLPIFLSSRKADAEMLAVVDEVFESTPFKGVYVGVLETPEALQMCQKYQMHVCIRPEITYEEYKAYRENILQIRRDRLLLSSGLETSAPHTKRGWWNEPRFIEETAAFMAKILKVTPQRFATNVFAMECCRNFARLLFADTEELLEPPPPPINEDDQYL